MRTPSPCLAAHALKLTEQLKNASLSLARQSGRRVQYLTSAASNKEDIARRIAAADHIDQGLICVLTAVEPCWSFEIVRDRASKRIEAEPRYRKCLHLYHSQIHPRFGFMSARIQTWLPFRIQICVNGREWLACSMDAAGLHDVQRDNCFTWLEHPEQAQHLMDQQLRSDWPVLLSGIARSLNPLHATMFAAFPIGDLLVHLSERVGHRRHVPSPRGACPSVSAAGATWADDLPQPGRDALPRPQGAAPRRACRRGWRPRW